jgi:ABC-2 type transport system permease protein
MTKHHNVSMQIIGLYTITTHELSRMFRISVQSFLPSLITTLLYFSIFGAVIGQQMRLIEGLSYSTFIAPGLIMIAVINNAYANSSSSLFSARFQRSIEEVLISPILPSLILIGYTLGGVLRALLVAGLVLIVAIFYIDLHWTQLPLTLGVVILIACLFSLAGFTNGMLAKTYDDVMVIPTFILSPLTYLGGVFYSISMLPAFWQHMVLLNPIFYMVELLRYALLNHPSEHVGSALAVLIGLNIGLFYLNVWLMKKGTGIRE